ncbi:MAG: LamG-like jellyroll fold domain-containing protein [Planctomycetota bacterium]
MDDKHRRLIDQLVNQTISKEDFDRLQDAFEHDADLRREYVALLGLCESLGEIALEDAALPVDSERKTTTATTRSNDTSASHETPTAPARPRFTSMRFAIAATVWFLLIGSFAFWLGQWNQSRLVEDMVTDGETSESRIAGHATLRRMVSLQWPDDSKRYLTGDVLPNGPLVFDSGLAEIDFFCGATLIVEGPASLEIESDWSVFVSAGRLRASVPPAARGFVVKTVESEIIDLGTEFAVEVKTDNVRVEVIDGEVALRGGEHDGKHLVTGESASLKGTPSDTSVIEGLSTMIELDQRHQEAEADGYRRWIEHSTELRSDDRMIAHFAIAEGIRERIVPNAALTGQRFDGLMVGPVGITDGRFGPESLGLEFDRPGSRVRTRIDGEFQAFTFTCWVRIDSLKHRYNALFMGDGYETGEPHWQIRDDGSLMFSVMVDDTQQSEHFSEIDQQMVQTAGLHRLYYTEPFWDISNSGQWFHLAAVYDPANRRVSQYVNGKQVASEAIPDRFHITTLRIGAAEIGNWGQPFRETPWFAVRNLDGTIDELTIFNAALSEEEVGHLYERGKPLGY